jgi:hypothetical protein
MSELIDFFCLGAQKAGTTSLHHLLAAHPDVFLPEIKETHFFNDGHGDFNKGLASYFSRHYSAAPPTSFKGEVDPEYMFFPEVPQRIFSAFPRAKLIFVLREPVSRAYSHYLMSRRRGFERLDFEAAVAAEPERMKSGDIQTRSDFSYVSRGFYHQQIARFLECFPREQMLFLLSEDLKARPEETLATVHRFLGLRAMPYMPVSDAESNQAAEPRSWLVQNLVSGNSFRRKLGGALLPKGVKGWIWDMVERHNRRPIKPSPPSPDIVARLKNDYTADMAALSLLIERDLSHWSRP